MTGLELLGLFMLLVMLGAIFIGLPISFEPHVAFKKRVPHAIGLIRTGDTTQYGNLILEQVASEAGYTRGALYHQFEDKEDLALAVLEWVNENWMREVGTPAKQEPAPVAELIALARGHVVSAGAGRLPCFVAAIRDGPGTRNDDDARRTGHASFQCNERIVYDDDSGFESNALHDPAHDRRVVFAVDAGNAEADGSRPDVQLANGLLHHVVEDFLDLELARSLEVRARPARFGEDVPRAVRELTDGLRAARVDAENKDGARIRRQRVGGSAHVQR